MAQNASADVQHTATWLAFPKSHSTVRVSMRPLALLVESTLTLSPPPLTSSPLHSPLTLSPSPPFTPSPLHSSLTPVLTGTCYSPERSTHGDCLWPSQNRYKPSWCLPQYISIHAHTLAHFLTLTPLTLTSSHLTPSPWVRGYVSMSLVLRRVFSIYLLI